MITTVDATGPEESYHLSFPNTPASRERFRAEFSYLRLAVVHSEIGETEG